MTSLFHLPQSFIPDVTSSSAFFALRRQSVTSLIPCLLLSPISRLIGAESTIDKFSNAFRYSFFQCLFHHNNGFNFQVITQQATNLTRYRARKKHPLYDATQPNMSNAALGLSLGSGGSASPAQLLGICCQTTCSAVQTLTFLRKSSRLFVSIGF